MAPLDLIPARRTSPWPSLLALTVALSVLSVGAPTGLYLVENSHEPPLGWPASASSDLQGQPSAALPGAVDHPPPQTRPSVAQAADSTLVVYNQTLLRGNFVATNGLSPFWLAVNSSSGLVFASDPGSNAVSVVNPTTMEVIATVAVGGQPNGLAFDAANGAVYVANSGSQSVSVVDGTTYRVLTTIPVGSEPMGVAYDPATQAVYVGNRGSDNISVINGSTNRVVASIAVGSPVGGMAVDSSNGDLYVADYVAQSQGEGDNVSIIDPSTNQLIGNVSVGGTPFDVAYDSANQLLYVSVVLGYDLAVINGSSNSVSSYVRLSSSSYGDSPFGLAADPTDGYVYIADWNASSVARLNTSTNTVSGAVRLGAAPLGLAYDAKAGTVFVAASGAFIDGLDTGGGSGPGLAVLNASTGAFVGNVTLGALPCGLVVDPAHDRVWVADALLSLTVLNGTTHQVLGSAPLGWDVLAGAYNPGNGYLYFSSNGLGPVAVFNGTTDGLVQTLGTWSTVGVAVDTANNWTYVSQDNPTPGFLYAFNGSTNRVAKQLYMPPYPNQPGALAFDDQNGRIYVADIGLDRISAVFGANDTIAENLSLSAEPSGLAFDPANGLLYVSEASAGAVVALDPSNGTIMATIPVGNTPAGLAFDPADGDLFVANQGSGNVTIIDGGSNSVVGSVLVGNDPVAVTADGMTGTVYVANEVSGTVSIIDPPPVFPVTFNETGLPPGTTWSVSLDGASNSSSASSIGFLHSNGTAIPYSVGGVRGYEPQPLAGTVGVSGAAVNVSVQFAQAQFPGWFNESGLPPGTAWVVTFNGTAYASAGTSIALTTPDGTFPFNVSNVPGWRLTSYRGNVTVDGAGTTEQLDWTQTVYAVTFEAVGLPTGTSWGVTIDGTLNVSGWPQIGFLLPNATSYEYSISGASGYVANRSAGTLSVSGSPVLQTVRFTQIGPSSPHVQLAAWGNLTALGGGDSYCLANGTLATNPAWANVSFQALAAGGSAPYTFSWAFGDGILALGENLTHHFQDWGPWNVTVTVTDANHVTNTTAVNATVTVPPIPPPICPPTASAGVPLAYLAVAAGGLALAAGIVFTLWRRRRRRTAGPNP